MNAIDSLLVEAEQEVTRRNYEVVSDVLHDTEWDRRVCAWAALHSKHTKVTRALNKVLKQIEPLEKHSLHSPHIIAEWCDLDDSRTALTKEKNELESRLACLERCGRCSVCSPASLRGVLRRTQAKAVINPVSFEPQFPDDYDDGYIAEDGDD